MHTIEGARTHDPSEWPAWFRAGITLLERDLMRLLVAVEAAVQRRRERRLLAGLDDRALSDLAISRADVWQEQAKSCWRD